MSENHNEDGRKGEGKESELHGDLHKLGPRTDKGFSSGLASLDYARKRAFAICFINGNND